MGFNVLKIKGLIFKKKISQEMFAAEISVSKQTIINYFIDNEIKVYPETETNLKEKLKEML